MSDQNDASGASSLIYGSAQDVTSQQRGLVASSSEQPVVPRILSTSSRTPHPQDMPPTFYEASSLNDLGPATASSSSTLNEEPEAPDPAIVDALRNAKERLFVLKLGESMENLVEQRREAPLQLAPPSSYQRMLVHRCASYYRLHLETDGPNKTIFVSATAQSRIPSVRMVDVVPSDTSSSPAFKIMRRSTTDKLGRKARSGSADAESDGSDAGSSGLSQKKKKNMTIAEREAAYNEARSRIFSSFEDRDEITSASSSTHSLSNPPSVSDNAINVTTVEDENKPPDSSALRTGSKGSAKRAGGKDRWNDPPRSSNSDFDPDFDRRSFSYAPIYEQPTPNAYDSPYAMSHPPHPEEQGYVPPHYAMYPPHPGYPPPYMTPYPYYYDIRHYGYPNHPPPQGRDGSFSANGPPGVSPYPMYPPAGMPGWHSPPPPPQPPQPSNLSAPVVHQNVPAPLSRVVSQGQPPPQAAQQQQPPIQAPYFNPVAPPFYPLPLSMANFDPAVSQLQPQQQLPPQHMLHQQQQGLVVPPPRAPPGTLYSVQDDSKSIGSGSSRLNASSRGSSRNNVREAAGAAVGRARANGGASGASPGPRNPSQLPRNPWSYGSGLAIPMAGGRRSGSSGSRAGSVSSRSGSAGAMTPADETGSIASSETSSSSSRKTFTSNSSRHPLPARPDWVGLPQRASSDHSRRSSGSSSALQAASSEFPPLPPSDRNATTLTNLSDPPITNGVWKPQGPSLGAPVRQPSGDSEQPRRSHSQPVSGGVTLGVLPSSGGSGSTTYSNAAPPRTSGTTTLPPPAPSLPPPPHRAYQQHAQQQQMRLSENDAAFKRPAPKSISLYEPGNYKSPSASPHRNSPTNMGGNVVGGGILDYQPQLTQSPISKSPAEEQNDRIRGEAVANAIFIDKMTSLQISAAAEAASAAVASATSSVSGTETNANTSAAEDSLARRRQSLNMGTV